MAEEESRCLPAAAVLTGEAMCTEGDVREGDEAHSGRPESEVHRAGWDTRHALLLTYTVRRELC